MAPSSALSTDAINRVRILGAKFNLDMRESLTAASISTGIDQTTQLSLSFADPLWYSLNHGAAVLGTRVDFDDFRLHIASIKTESMGNTEGFTLQCRPVLVSALKARRGAKVMTNVSPSDFVRAEAKAAGFTSMIIEPSARRKQVARDIVEKGRSYDPNSIPSSWTTFQRLASELGYVCFEVANTLYFGKPSWFIKRTGATTVRAGYRTGAEMNQLIEVPECNKSYDSKQTTVSLTVLPDVASVYLPGRKLILSGVPAFNGSYLISSTSYDLYRPENGVSVDAETPQDPEPNPPGSPSSSSGSSGSSSSGSGGPRRGTKSALDFVYWAQRQLGDRYVFGAAVSSSTDPSSFDCSSLVKWAASMVGVYMPRTSEEQINWCTRHGTRISVDSAKHLRGALLWHPGHVAISLGNGRTIEAANSRVGVVSYGTGNRFQRAARLPSMHY